MARGPGLTVAEKYAIQSMLEAGLTPKKMAQHLRRSENFVNKYITEELSNTVQLIEETKELISNELFEKVVDVLIANGVEEHDARASMNKVRLKITSAVEDTQANVATLVSYALRENSPKKLMITKTSGRKKGVSIMTKAAGELGDDLRSKRQPPDNSSFIFRGN